MKEKLAARTDPINGVVGAPSGYYGQQQAHLWPDGTYRTEPAPKQPVDMVALRKWALEQAVAMRGISRMMVDGSVILDAAKLVDFAINGKTPD